MCQLFFFTGQKYCAGRKTALLLKRKDIFRIYSGGNSMICRQCGSKIDDNSSFCKNCGAKIEDSEIDCERVTLCEDGVYRWYYEFPMMKNTVILFTVFKVCLIAALVPAIISGISPLFKGKFTEFLKVFFGAFGITAGIMCVLSVIAYTILAAAYGWRYKVLFEMDEDGVVHTQQDKQFEKAQAIAWITAGAGISAANFTVAGSGLLAGSKQSSSSSFANVEKVIGLRRQNTIKVNQLLSKNQVYVRPEDYDFVWEYITSRCKNAKKIKE